MSVLDHTSVHLHDALSHAIGEALGVDAVSVCSYHTGGGVMVCDIDLTQDGRNLGRTLWLTREGVYGDWMLGFYDWNVNPDDDGVLVYLILPGEDADDPALVAGAVAGILKRLGVTLQ